MLYLVSVNGVSAGGQFDDDEDFIVEAENEENLAAAIVANRMDDGEDPKELDGSIWCVRKLCEEFDYGVNIEYNCEGARL